MEKALQLGGRELFYREYGQGKPVVLLHGFGESGDVWQHQAEFLNNDFRVIVPDLPGSGRSEMVDDMSMEGLADVMMKLIDKIVPAEKVHLVGHSMGGYITLAFVDRYAERLHAFGLFHSTAYADTEEKKATRRKGIDFARKHGAFEFLKTSSPNLFSPITKQQNPAMVDEFIRGLHNFSTDAIVSYYEAMIARPDRRQLLKTTHLPVLFVIGSYDNAIPVKDMLEQSHLPEKAYIDLLHQSGHMGMLEEINKSNELLKKFVTET